MLDFRIETFITVCDLMNFTKAAEKLNITQPAVSQHIKYLEELYGVKLFQFNGKKINITESGKLLLNTAITMKHDEIHLKENLKAQQEKNQTLNFGATLTIGEFLMPEKLAAIIKEKENVLINMLIANTKELLEKLDNGTIDFAIVEGYFAKNDYDHKIFSKEKYAAVCSPNHKFQKFPQKVEDLFVETLITREEGSGTREILERSLESRNLSLNDFKRKVEISNINVIKELVKNDCGISFLYEAAVKEELESGLIKKIELRDMNVEHDMTFIWRKNSVFASYYCELFEILKKY
ncbi:MAG: LysR substrate-binding domain-containing protein [Aminipila sp.]